MKPEPARYRKTTIDEALKFGHEANQAINELQEEFLKDNQKPKMEAPPAWNNPELAAAVAAISDKMSTCVGQPDRQTRQAIEDSLKKELIENFKDKFSAEDINTAFDLHMKALMRSQCSGKITAHGWPALYGDPSIILRSRLTAQDSWFRPIQPG